MTYLISRRTRTAAALAGAISTLAAAQLRAQEDKSPWTVTLAPPSSVPIGNCGAVHLTVFDDAKKERARNAIGQNISMADFDLTVSSANERAVVGKYDGPNWFGACVCPGAQIGQVGTVTATYPAKMLPARARAPGVEFQTSATFTFSTGGAGNPPGCDGNSAQAVRVGVATPTIPTVVPPAGGGTGTLPTTVAPIGTPIPVAPSRWPVADTTTRVAPTGIATKPAAIPGRPAADTTTRVPPPGTVTKPAPGYPSTKPPR
ncbi:MAG: hypothetical protein ABJD07_08995, partial [Gemmatimonadaceae bacterium]